MVPVIWEPRPKRDRSLDQVRLYAEQALNQSARRNAGRIPEVPLRLLSMHVQFGRHVEVAGAETLIHGVKQIALQQPIRLVCHASLKHRKGEVHVLRQYE